MGSADRRTTAPLRAGTVMAQNRRVRRSSGSVGSLDVDRMIPLYRTVTRLLAVLIALLAGDAARADQQARPTRAPSVVEVVAYRTALINAEVGPVSDALLRKHYERKHGPKATYGQKSH